MIPLIFCSVLMIALIIERVWTYRKNVCDSSDLLEDVKQAYSPGQDPTKVNEILDAAGIPGKVFKRGIKNAGRGADSIEMAMEHEASALIPTLEANLPIIKTIVNIAPLLGLLGTIAGMISSFRAASQAGLSNPTAILGGISEALISTATGISLAVIGFIFFNYFANVVQKTVSEIETYGAELVNYLTDRVD